MGREEIKLCVLCVLALIILPTKTKNALRKFKITLTVDS
jgi:hypothetical protein